MRIDAIADRVASGFLAAKGIQVRRKDKDFMRDTGGISKGRDREPDSRPPRDDVKKRYRDKRLTPEEKQDKERTAGMAEEVGVEDDALAQVDQAVDVMISATRIIDENLAKIKIAGVPQKAAVDAVRDTMDTAIKPYLADIVRAMRAFGGD